MKPLQGGIRCGAMSFQNLDFPVTPKGRMKTSEAILLIEDDHIDILAVQRAIKELGAHNPLQIAKHGSEALHLLRRGNNLPGIILLDLNMPHMNGIEFLEQLKQDKDLRQIPTVVLTTSSDEEDRQTCFALGVAGYMIKPVEYTDFISMLRTILEYWSLSELPNYGYRHLAAHASLS